MLKKLLTILLLVSLFFIFNGCRKKSGEQAASGPLQDYQAQAKSQINKDNMSAELDKLEKSIDADVNAVD